MIKLFSTLLFSLAIVLSYAQTLNFNLFLFGKEIGKTTVNRTFGENGIIIYTLKTDSRVKAFGVDRFTKGQALIKFQKGELLSSYYLNETNEEGKTESFTKKIESGYSFKSGLKEFCIRRIIKRGSISLYFEEPNTTNEYFSERLGSFFKFEKVAESTYRTKVNSVTATYKYINGKLVELEMAKSLGSVYMRIAN